MACTKLWLDKSEYYLFKFFNITLKNLFLICSVYSMNIVAMLMCKLYRILAKLNVARSI